MKTDVQAKNQQAINEFFEAFGTETAKEYSEDLFFLLTMVVEKKDLSDERRVELTDKLRDLNRLVLQLGAVHREQGQAFESIGLKN